MLKRTKIALICMITLSLICVGCVKKQNAISVKQDNDVTRVKNIELKLWSWYSFENEIKGFESENKGIKVKTEIFDFDKCNEEYMKALASGSGPDVLVFDSVFFGQYTVNGVLQDLLQEPFGAGKYKKDFLGWESGLSIDNEQLLALTLATYPYVTMYRADIMQENGFPYEPKELGEYIEKPENLITIAKKLKDKNKYIFQLPTDMTNIVGGTLGYFDKNLNYTRYGDLYAKALDISKEAHKNELEINGNFWNEVGKTAIQEERLVMINAVGSCAMTDLKNYVPEQKGKWRVTKPALGLASWASDSKLSMNAQSNYKEQAWKLIEYLATHKYNGGENSNMVPGYIPTHKNPKNMARKEEFFGDQNVNPMLEELAEKMVQYKLTPMDVKANSLYTRGIWDASQQNTSSNEAIAQMRSNVDSALVEEKRALKE